MASPIEAGADSPLRHFFGAFFVSFCFFCLSVFLGLLSPISLSWLCAEMLIIGVSNGRALLSIVRSQLGLDGSVGVVQIIRLLVVVLVV